MAYTPKTIHSGNQAGGYSCKNAQDLAVVLEAIDTALGVAGDITAAAAATAEALTGTLTGTEDGALNDITYNATWSQAQASEVDLNFKEVQSQVNALIVDVGLIRTAVNAIITAMA